MNKTDKANSKLLPALEYIENHVDASPSLDEMAALCGISACYFSRTFHHEMGISYINYLNSYKCKLACAQLTGEKRVKISELSASLGYSDPSYFIRIFKKHVGCTPLVYKKRSLAAK